MNAIAMIERCSERQHCEAQFAPPQYQDAMPTQGEHLAEETMGNGQPEPKEHEPDAPPPR